MWLWHPWPLDLRRGRRDQTLARLRPSWRVDRSCRSSSSLTSRHRTTWRSCPSRRKWTGCLWNNDFVVKKCSCFKWEKSNSIKNYLYLLFQVNGGSESIWILNFKFRFQMVRYSNGQFMCYVLFTTPTSGYWTSTLKNKIVFICPVFKWHLGVQPFFDHLNTKLVWYSDPHCS